MQDDEMATPSIVADGIADRPFASAEAYAEMSSRRIGSPLLGGQAELTFASGLATTYGYDLDGTSWESRRGTEVRGAGSPRTAAKGAGAVPRSTG